MADPIKLIERKIGNWWQDDRRNWCAYCGVGMRHRKGPSSASTIATGDHVIARAHASSSITIPSCRRCNGEKADRGIAEFLNSPYFSGIREKKHPRQWSLRDLWLVMALAAVEQAKKHSAEWPAATGPTPQLSSKQGPVVRRKTSGA